MFIDFLVAYKYWIILILGGLCLILQVIKFFLKRPCKVVDTLHEKILNILPTFIRIAEDKYGAGHGKSKLEYVIELVKDWFDGQGYPFTEMYEMIIKNAVENILDTPNKKK